MNASTSDSDQRISIVVASKVAGSFLERCLSSFKDQAIALGAETIVVASGDKAFAERIRTDFPWTTVVDAPEIKEVPALRRRGVEAAAGEFLFVIEEHCSAGPDWLEKGLDAHAKGRYAAVGGPIFDDAYKASSDWTTYFIEYNSAMPPFPEGETPLLNEANIVYRRSVLLEHKDLLDDGYWPMALHPTLAARGHKFFMVPDMVVRHLGPWDYNYYLHQRYLFSRAFAGVRARSESLGKRIIYATTAPVLPFILFLRIGRVVAAKGNLIARFIRTAPWIFPALVVYVAGEWMGYVFGPGDALSKVE